MSESHDAAMTFTASTFIADLTFGRCHFMLASLEMEAAQSHSEAE